MSMSLAMSPEAAATLVGCEGSHATAVCNTLFDEFGVVTINLVPLPSAVTLLSGHARPETLDWARRRILRTVQRSGSSLVTVVAHASCAGHPGTPDEQIEALDRALTQLREWLPDLDLVGLWVDECGEIDRLA